MITTAYLDAGFVPVIGCIFSTALDYVKDYYQGFTDNITFQDGRFYAEGEGTMYYWEEDTLFVRRKINE